MTKSAVALFVKDEVFDISGWIAWHVALGFDKIYIYDDHSIDGTYQACLNAATAYDISVFRTDRQAETNFFWRQRDSYFDACRRAAGVYDWIALIDSDEYISLEHDVSINTYLEKFSKFNAIALNWCIYGSAARVLKDHIPVYDAFIAHSTKELDDNHLIKSFIRPDVYSFNYTDPHKYQMIDERYADALGQSIQMGGATKDIVWEGARVNHYICRSMEHYVSRIGRRLGADLYNSTVYWEHFNRNDEYSRIADHASRNANVVLSRLKRKTIENFISDLRSRNLVPTSVVQKIETRSIFQIATCFGDRLCLNNSDGHLTRTSDLHPHYPVYGLREGKRLFVFARIENMVSNINFHITNYEKKSYCFEFDIVDSDDGKFFLKNILSGKFLCSVQDSMDVDCNRISPSDWEKFELVDGQSEFLSNKPVAKVLTADDMMHFVCFGEAPTVDDFLVAASCLPVLELDTLKDKSGKVLSWII